MDPDLFFVIGLVICAFTIPPILGALLDGRAPRAAAILVLIGGGMIAIAVSQKPEGYELSQIPDVFVRVIGRYVD